MLGILRRVFSFADWTQHHPNEPPPGDMLDASFDAQNSRISELEQLVSQILRSDGALQNGTVHWDSLEPAFRGSFEKHLTETTKSIEDRVFSLMRMSEAAASVAKDAADRAQIAIGKAETTKINLEQAESRTEAQLGQLTARQAQISQLLTETAETRSDWDDASSEAQAWADSSRLWAEHMPDTLPDNALKIMDVTGDHWSSRWWANKAAGAFGAMSSLYLGAHPVPPSTTNTGDPIPLGAIYYNTETGQMYVWDGSQWVSMTQPQRAGLAALWYNAADGQTAFPFATMDLNGRNYALSIDATEGVDAHVNGIKLMPKETGTEGDWTLNNATSTVTFLRPLRLGDIVSFDILMANSKLGPGQVYVWALKKAEAQDGVRTTFTLSTKAAGGPAVTISKNEELLVSLDGVVQEPAVSYSAAGNTITFAQPPAADAYSFFTWFRPGA